MILFCNMKKLILLFTLFAFVYKAQTIFYFENKQNQRDSILIFTDKELSKDFKPIKSIRTKLNDEKKLNFFENQVKYLAIKCKKAGGNAVYINWIEDISFNQFVMKAVVYQIPIEKFFNKVNDKNIETELLLYRPKYYTGLTSIFKVVEIFIDGDKLDFSKGSIFHKKIDVSSLLIEIPKYNYSKKIDIIQNKINYVKLMLIPQQTDFTGGGNQIVIPLGSNTVLLEPVSEIQAEVELDNMLNK
ncbi:TPA: hypothetical protein L3261_001533 [Elizabethkingia anophelis]|nr:hypothetical protein [Elizabethkingia anophelis]HBN6706076.1 hypothetical protein [Elizabethkingia anophelis]HBN6710108.1 hypothetical protein [Elizabethkingia anophelis]HBN6712905.1 hypothetical protein [Elizabethkingia anophelis]HBN6718433.1 hypothetical protein [Elizabethkingia anophelis]